MTFRFMLTPHVLIGGRSLISLALLIRSVVPILGAFYPAPIIGAMEKSVHTPEYAFLRSQLRAAREQAGLSQRALAGRLSVPHSWIAKVESGERRIDLVEFGWFISTCGIDPIPVCSQLLGKIVARQAHGPSKGGRAK